MKTLVILFALAIGLPSSQAQASDAVTTEPDKNSYHFVSHYSVEIDAPAAAVWPHLINLGSWMDAFEMALQSGDAGEIGAVYRLYPQQDFFVQITSLVPERSLVLANLPATFRGEQSTGVAVINLTELDGKTLVSLTMSRRYSWLGEGENPLKTTRTSAAFQEGTRRTWDGFLQNLQKLAE